MSRIVLQYLLPLLLPAALYFGWVMMAERRGLSVEQALARLRQGPWFWLALAGFALMTAGLLTFALVDGADPNSTYRPPRYEDGRVTPGDFEPERR
jgi:heme A synthase